MDVSPIVFPDLARVKSVESLASASQAAVRGPSATGRVGWKGRDERHALAGGHFPAWSRGGIFRGKSPQPPAMVGVGAPARIDAALEA